MADDALVVRLLAVSVPGWAVASVSVVVALDLTPAFNANQRVAY